MKKFLILSFILSSWTVIAAESNLGSKGFVGTKISPIIAPQSIKGVQGNQNPAQGAKPPGHCCTCQDPHPRCAGVTSSEN